MARAKVIHSDDAVHIKFNGNKATPEPTMAVISFPGGHVEVSRCSDGTYWAHTYVTESAKINQSRIDYLKPVSDDGSRVVDIPHEQDVKKIAINIAV